MADIQILALIFIITNLYHLPVIGAPFISVAVPNPSVDAQSLVVTVIMLVLSILTALICFLSSKVFAKELRRSFILISLGIAIISVGYFLEIQSRLGFSLLFEVNDVSKSLVGVMGFLMIFAGLYNLYKKSLAITRTVNPYKH